MTDSAASAPARFATTRWSLVLSAGRNNVALGAEQALETLCASYWYPLYAHARRKGLSPPEAEDCTQAFFTTLLEKDGLAAADRARGRFRTFLLAAFGHFLSNARDHDRAQIRGGGKRRLSFDVQAGESRLVLEPAHTETAERLFDREWAVALLDRALARLRDEYDSDDKRALFGAIKPSLAGDRGAPYAETGARLGMTEGAVKVAACRLRSRARELVRLEIAETVASPAEIDDELELLFAALAT
jgi:DNA-directed RNA polymerase specialized sigma24 family protein